MRITRYAGLVAARGIQMFIIGVLGTASVLAQSGPGPVASVALDAGSAATARPLAAEGGTPTVIQILAGRSTLIDVGSPVARVSLTSPEIADALVTSPTQVLVHGKVSGTISMFVWDRSGGVKRYEIAVQRDLARLSDQMKQLFPGEAIQVGTNGRHIVLSGKVANKSIIDGAVNVASGYADKREDVVTLLQIQEGRTSQVLLKVRFAEVSRSALTEFGMSFFTSPTGVKNTIGRVTTQQFGAPGFQDLAWTKASGEFGSPVTSAEGKFSFGDFLNLFFLNQKYDLGVMIKALQNQGLFESLAEPNLVAESGKEASFLAGGEFPIPVAQGSGGNMAVSVEFKEFGIRLNFTPTVNGDRVHLKVRPEVSTLDYANAVTLNGFRIPALSTRRTQTELELRDGQTFAIAGLMNNQMNSTLQKIPGIGDIPILGHLFRSKAAQKQQTELVVMITPMILKPDSNGVTDQLPRYPEPFLAPVPENRSIPAPAPAFGPQSRSQADVAAPVDTVAEMKALEAARQQLALQDQANAAAAAAAKQAESRTAKQVEDDARAQKKEAAKLEKLEREQAKRDAKAAELAVKEEAKRAEAQRKAEEKLNKEQSKLKAAGADDEAKLKAAGAEYQAEIASQTQR